MPTGNEEWKNWHFIATYTGKHFYLDKPEFDIEDIAHATSMQCRFTGHVKNFYSVAEHNVLVARLCAFLDMGDPYEGLMHDAQEAYLSDIAAPWKSLLPDYKIIEGKLEKDLRKWAGIPGDKTSDLVKRADWIALFIEAHHLMKDRGKDFMDPLGLREQAYLLALSNRFSPHNWTPTQAKAAFLERYAILKPRSN